MIDFRQDKVIAPPALSWLHASILLINMMNDSALSDLRATETDITAGPASSFPQRRMNEQKCKQDTEGGRQRGWLEV